MAKKITDLTAISDTTFNDTDLFELSVDAGAGAFISRKITGAELKSNLGIINLGSADQTNASKCNLFYKTYHFYRI